MALRIWTVISEKTVELNVTAELLNWLYGRTKTTHTAIAPSQVQEGRLGWDVAYIGSKAVGLLQYKRAYVARSIWAWRLNRNRGKDQHHRLQLVEGKGLPVFYAFPFYCTPKELVANRLRLLVATFWWRPSMITPSGGPFGHHDVKYDPARRRWWVESGERIELGNPLTLQEVTEILVNGSELQPPEVESVLNDILFQRGEDLVGTRAARRRDGTAARGQSLLLRHESAHPAESISKDFNTTTWT